MLVCGVFRLKCRLQNIFLKPYFILGLKNTTADKKYGCADLIPNTNNLSPYYCSYISTPTLVPFDNDLLLDSSLVWDVAPHQHILP